MRTCGRCGKRFDVGTGWKSGWCPACMGLAKRKMGPKAEEMLRCSRCGKVHQRSKMASTKVIGTMTWSVCRVCEGGDVTETMRQVADGYDAFWRRQGKTPPPVSSDVVEVMYVDEQGVL